MKLTKRIEDLKNIAKDAIPGDMPLYNLNLTSGTEKFKETFTPEFCLQLLEALDYCSASYAAHLNTTGHSWNLTEAGSHFSADDNKVSDKFFSDMLEGKNVEQNPLIVRCMQRDKGLLTPEMETFARLPIGPIEINSL
jgi:hypothetical protein